MKGGDFAAVDSDGRKLAKMNSQVCEQNNGDLKRLRAMLPYCGASFFKAMVQKALAFRNFDKVCSAAAASR